jgi:hypothetical protein
MISLIKYVIPIIEQPYAKKPYEDYANYLKSINNINESIAIYDLISKRFENGYNNTDISKE